MGKNPDYSNLVRLKEDREWKPSRREETWNSFLHKEGSDTRTEGPGDGGGGSAINVPSR